MMSGISNRVPMLITKPKTDVVIGVSVITSSSFSPIKKPAPASTARITAFLTVRGTIFLFNKGNYSAMYKRYLKA